MIRRSIVVSVLVFAALSFLLSSPATAQAFDMDKAEIARIDDISSSAKIKVEGDKIYVLDRAEMTKDPMIITLRVYDSDLKLISEKRASFDSGMTIKNFRQWNFTEDHCFITFTEYDKNLIQVLRYDLDTHELYISPEINEKMQRSLKFLGYGDEMYFSSRTGRSGRYKFEVYAIDLISGEIRSLECPENDLGPAVGRAHLQVLEQYGKILMTYDRNSPDGDLKALGIIAPGATEVKELGVLDQGKKMRSGSLKV